MFKEHAAPGGVYKSFLAELKDKPDLLSNAELVGGATHPANVFRVQQGGFNSVLKVSNSSDEAAARYYGVLLAPTDTPASLTNIFDDLIAFGCELENIERSIDRKASKLKITELNFTSYKSFSPLDVFDPPVPAPAGGPAIEAARDQDQSPQTQRVRRKRDGPEPNVVEEPKVPESQWRSADRADFMLPDENEVRLGAYDDPRVYYDFNGPLYFQLEFSLAPQLNISDHNKVLIPPWKLYNALRPGALIMSVVQISTFGFPEGSRIRKTFQLEAKQIWIGDRNNLTLTTFPKNAGKSDHSQEACMSIFVGGNPWEL
ncbi:hypothetical protein C8J57DRAFT_1476245 [Mycena rebaudengoi]|nr:hypothetical protein C8J57DRAFT_1476245 [Mycena rebaudengoi]